MADGASNPVSHSADVILAGGGLANVLIALKLKRRNPDIRLLVIERAATLGANHTWSFHDTDVTPENLAWLKPMIHAHWVRQEVRFPGHRRVLETGYNTILSDRFHEVAAATLGDAVRVSTEICQVHPDRVVLGNGEVLTAPCVIDGRGALQEQPLALGYQKFVGLEIETEAPHGLAHPVIMDATVPQIDGYRFVYLLPFTPTTILVEDTYYSDTPSLDRAALTERCKQYAAAKGWKIKQVLREEAGVLPITLAGDIERHWSQLGSSLPQAGLRAWLFHPTTGYSLPYAVRLSDRITGLNRLTSGEVARSIIDLSRSAWASQGIFRLLNRMLFLAARPHERVRVLERFYTLPQPLVERFYAAQLTQSDAARILSGKPPVSLLSAVMSVSEQSAWNFVARMPPARNLG